MQRASRTVLTAVCPRTAFECPFGGCGRMFSVNSNMRRHFRTHGAGADGAEDADESERANAYPRDLDEEDEEEEGSEEWSSGER